MVYRNRWRGLLLFGAPGIGKGTQAKRLAADSDVIHIESSALLQEFMREYPHEVRSEPLHAMFDPSGALKTAKLFEDAPHFSVVQDRLMAMEQSGRYTINQLGLYDGLIRTGEQAKMFDWILDIPACLYFDESLVPEEEMIAHWKERNRPGETLEMFLERQQIFKGKAKSLLDFYRKDNRLVTIDPSGTKDQVYERLVPIVASYKP